MERKWYYAVDGVRHGPVTFEELRVLVESGTLGEFALVWQPEFGPAWRGVGQVGELFAQPVPPPPRVEIRAAEVPLLGVTGARPSATEAAAQAFTRMAGVLFRPFDIARWLSMGFCAWLSTLSLPVGGLSEKGQAQPGTFKELLDGLLEGVVRVVGQTSGTAWVVAAVFWTLLGIWLCSLRSRGEFMFLQRWYRPDTPILPCWRAAGPSGHALFLWRLAFYGVATLLFVLLGLYAYASVIRPYVEGGKVWDAALSQPAVACATAALLLGLGVELVGHLVSAFVVPVMYWRGVSATRAWLAVFALCNQYPFAVLGYLCVGVLCSVAACIALLALVIGTCCLGAIPLALPYFNGVALLPFTLFFRGYAVYFISRWRPDLVPATA